MCQGCEDFMEFDRAVDAYIAKELPKLMQRLAVEVLFGTSGSNQCRCSKCNHDEHVGMCGWRKTETIRDDVGYGGIAPTGITRTMLVDSCSCIDGVEVGQWVTFEASNGWKVRGKVTEVREDGYTVEQFPDAPQWVSGSDQ